MSTTVRALAEWAPKTKIVCDHIANRIIDPLLRGEELPSFWIEGIPNPLDNVILNDLLELVKVV